MFEMKVLCLIVNLVVVRAAYYVEDYHDLVGIPLAAKIKEYEDKLFSGVPEQEARIGGGDPVAEGALPYMAGLIVELERKRTSMCGGALVKATRVVTAAQCLHRAARIEVVLGSLHYFYGGFRIRTTVFTAHPEFNKFRSLDYDVGMVKIKDGVQFTDVIQPIGLPVLGDGEEYGEKGVTAGWGLTTNEDVTTTASVALTQITLQIIPEKIFKNYYNCSFKVWNNICAQKLAGGGVCKGDIGGPLVMKRQGKDVLFGITSYAVRLCESDFPSTFSRVQTYDDFILND